MTKSEKLIYAATYGANYSSTYDDRNAALVAMLAVKHMRKSRAEWLAQDNHHSSNEMREEFLRTEGVGEETT